MHSLEEFRVIIEEEIRGLRIKEEPGELYDPIRYILSHGGKRIRPALALMGCEMYVIDFRKALPAAIALEIFHNFTLIHDDIMDRAPLRRGMPTVHHQWNENIAILSGDTMLPMAYELLMQLEPSVIRKVMRRFNNTAMEVCEGQQMDLNFESRDDVSIEEYLEMIRLKTAVLLGASLEIGAMTGGAPEPDLEKLYDFGVQAGIAFQIRDDLLDVFGEEDLFGKQNSGDIVTNKKTFLYLKALEMAGQKDKMTLDHFFSMVLDDNNEKISRVKEVFLKVGVKEEAEKEIGRRVGAALAALEGTSADEDGKNELKKLVDKIVNRNY